MLIFFYLPARLLITGQWSFGIWEEFFHLKTYSKLYKNYFNQIIVIGSNLENCEDLQIKRNDTFNSLIDDFLKQSIGQVVCFNT